MNENELNIENVADELLKVLRKAIKQSNNTMLKTKKKVVSTEYDDELKKPMQEITEEFEEITKLKGTVDVNSLKTVASLLKEINIITGNADTPPEDEHGVIVLADVKDLENDDK